MTIDSVEELTAALTRLTSEDRSQEALSKATAELLADFDANAIPPELRFRPPGSSGRGYLVHRDRRFTVTTVVWSPGQRTVPHDHQTWGTILVVENEIEETRFEVTSTEPRRAKLEVTDIHHHLGGAISLLYEGNDVHQMFNPTTKDTFEIHIYGDDLVGRPRLCWQDDGEEQTFVTDPYENC